MSDAPDEADAVPSFECGPERSVADEGQGALAAVLEGAREAEDVLALGEAAEAEERRAVAAPAEVAAGLLAVSRREALEVDAAVDDLGLAARVRHGQLEPVAKPARDGDDGGRAPNDVSCRSPNARDRADVRDVLSVRGYDERRARRERRRKSRGDEEVRVDDVGMEAPRYAHCVSEEGEVAPTSSGPRVDDRALDLVSSCDELALEVGHEDPEVRVLAGPGTSARRGGSAGALPARDLEDPEAHLVGRSLSPEDVARRRRHAVAAVCSLADVVAARDAHDVAGLRLDRTRQGVRVLPVEVPARDVEQDLRARACRD